MRLKRVAVLAALSLNAILLFTGCSSVETHRTSRSSDLDLIMVSKPIGAPSTMNTGHVYFKITPGRDLKSRISAVPTIEVLGPISAKRTDETKIESKPFADGISLYLLNIVYDPSKCQKNNTDSIISFVTDDDAWTKTLPKITTPNNCNILSFGLIPAGADTDE